MAREARFIVLSLPSEAALDAVCEELVAAQAKRLVGDTREALEADADELLAQLKPGGSGSGNGFSRVARLGIAG